MISICMAVYNGARYLEEQIFSITQQLSADDEIVIVDDQSTDDSGNLIARIADPRIRYLRNEKNIGVVATFERAIREARGQYIFLSDQDDIWADDKISRILESFSSTQALCVFSDALLVDVNNVSLGRTFFEWRNSRTGLVLNWFKNSFMGCTMAFSAELRDIALPFPEGIYMHDQWLGLIATAMGHVAILNRPLIRYRRHGGNVTEMKRSPPLLMLKRRLTLGRSLLARLPRAWAHRARTYNRRRQAF